MGTDQRTSADFTPKRRRRVTGSRPKTPILFSSLFAPRSVHCCHEKTDASPKRNFQIAGPGTPGISFVLATVIWGGGGDGSDWHDPLNWSGAEVPGIEDDVVLQSNVIYDVHSDVKIGSLKLEDAYLRVFGSRFEVADVITPDASYSDIFLANSRWVGDIRAESLGFGGQSTVDGDLDVGRLGSAGDDEYSLTVGGSVHIRESLEVRRATHFELNVANGILLAEAAYLTSTGSGSGPIIVEASVHAAGSVYWKSPGEIRGDFHADGLLEVDAPLMVGGDLIAVPGSRIRFNEIEYAEGLPEGRVTWNPIRVAGSANVQAEIELPAYSDELPSNGEFVPLIASETFVLSPEELGGFASPERYPIEPEVVDHVLGYHAPVSPDFSVRSIEVPDEFIIQESNQVSWTVDVEAGDVWQSSWSDEVYLSKDEFLDSEDRRVDVVRIGSGSVQSAQDGGQWYRATAEFEWPAEFGESASCLSMPMSGS